MLNFELGSRYTRSDVKERAGFSRKAKGGYWDTGVVEHENEFLIFANVGTEGRTGHNYGNKWEGSSLRWYHKAGSHLAWQSVQKLLEPGRSVHVFWRTSNEAPFEYAGMAIASEIADTSPVEILWTFEGNQGQAYSFVDSPEQVPRGEYREGAVRQVLVNTYERVRLARQKCISYYGLSCSVCGLRFEDRYGTLGVGFIHVHHLVPLSELGSEYELDPIKDLRPVCANCHAMLHRRRPPVSIEALRSAIQKAHAGLSSQCTGEGSRNCGRKRTTRRFS